MNGEIRRAKIENILKSSAVPVPGVTLAKDLDVSRQIIVSDIALLRANGLTILSTNKGYMIPKQSVCQRVFKVIHADDQVGEELSLIVCRTLARRHRFIILMREVTRWCAAIENIFFHRKNGKIRP